MMAITHLIQFDNHRGDIVGVASGWGSSVDPTGQLWQLFGRPVWRYPTVALNRPGQ